MLALLKKRQWLTVLLPVVVLDICLWYNFRFFQLHWTNILKTNTEPFQYTADYPHMLFIPAIILLFIELLIIWLLEKDTVYLKFLSVKMAVFLVCSYGVWYYKFAGNQSPFIPAFMEKYWQYFLNQWLLIGIDILLIGFILWHNWRTQKRQLT